MRLLARKKTPQVQDHVKTSHGVNGFAGASGPGHGRGGAEAPGARGPSVFNQHCPSQVILERIADKWTTLVIYKLDKKTMRFGELKREIGGVSQKMLTQTLRNLEADGLVTRTVYPVVPPKVEYSLTPLGRTLLSPLGALCRWAQEHWEDVAKMTRRRRTKGEAAGTH